MDGNRWDSFTQVFTTHIGLTLVVVVHTDCLICSHMETTHWHTFILSDVDVASSLLSVHVCVVYNDAFTGCKAFSTYFHTFFFCLEIIIVDSNVVFKLTGCEH